MNNLQKIVSSEIYKNNKQYNSLNPFYNLNQLESFSNKNNATFFCKKNSMCTLRNLFIIILIIVTYGFRL